MDSQFDGSEAPSFEIITTSDALFVCGKAGKLRLMRFTEEVHAHCMYHVQILVLKLIFGLGG